MSEADGFEVQLHRRAVHGGLVADDAPAIRAWLQQVAADTFALTGTLPPAIRLVGDGFVETCDLGALGELGRESLVAALFVSIDRPGVKRRVREGEATLRVDGAARRVIVLLEWRSDGAFWLATRRVGVGAGEAGVFHGDWQERQGVGLGELGEPFDEWADPGDAALTGVQTSEPAPPPAAEIAGSFGDLAVDAPVDPAGLADVLGLLLDVELAGPGPKPLMILAFSGRRFERYDVRGELPCPLDDLVRAIAARADATGVAVVHPTVVQTPQGPLRGFGFAIETGGRRVDRVLLLRRGADGAAQKRVLIEDRGESAGKCWLGVPPSGDVTLFALGSTAEA